MTAQPLQILLIIAFTFSMTAQGAPPLPIDQALSIANGTLKERNLGDQYWITSITLESTSVGRKPSIWVVRWNAPIMLEEAKRETGLEIQMDGSYARYVDKTSVTPATAGIPAGRAALSNHRTRSDRPSILDLKH